MENEEVLITLLKSKKKEILDLWLQIIEELYPTLYNLDDLRENGRAYFDLIIDYYIPFEEHEYFEIISRMCLYHAQRKTPIEHIMHSSHIWRKSILHVIRKSLHEQPYSLEEIRNQVGNVHERIDQLQRTISSTYLEYSNQLVYQRDKEINELHNDRLNMLGKVAANMAHEIRNPLTAIEGFIKLVRLELTGYSVPKIVNYLDIIDKELDGLYRQVTSFLSFSKNNGIEEPLISFESDELIHSAIELMSPRLIDEKVEFDIALEATHLLNIQKTAIQQVLTNLINNAIDALQEVHDGKKIRISTFEEETNFFIRITDNGIGIPEELKNKIFEPFVTGKQNGTGLGLSICKQIMGKNQGDILFTSGEGETSFTLTFRKPFVS